MDRRVTIDMFPNGVDERMMIRDDVCDIKVAEAVLGLLQINTDNHILQNMQPFKRRFIGKTEVFHTFHRDLPNRPYRYAGLCEAGKTKNLHPMPGKKVFIISQYHADTKEEMDFNAKFAGAIAKKLLEDFGDIPIAPHIYFTQFVKDEGWQRDFCIEAGHLMMRACDSVIVAKIGNRISEGMQMDIDYAVHELGIQPMEFNFTEVQALDLVEKMENDKDGKDSRAEH